MKKNKMMRAASALLVAVLLTTCVISGTYAKYTTTATGSDSARVARWGFETTTVTFEAFANEYDGSVEGKNEAIVVAPGTTKDFTVSLLPTEGTPEVDYSFNVDLTANADADLLNKLVWSLNDTVIGTFAELQAKINENYDKATIQANTLPTNNIKITWEWPFEKTTDADWDTTDTALGNETVLANIEITLRFTATQLN